MLCSTRLSNDCRNVRCFMNITLKESKISNQTQPVVAKKYKDIPGPKGVFGIGTFYQYFPFIGKYNLDELHKFGMEKYLKYGDIVKERTLPGADIIFIYDPHDIAKVLNDTGPDKYPRRHSHLALAKYRKDRPNIYKNAGLIPTNGPDWWCLRSELQKSLGSPVNIRKFLSDADNITKEFVTHLNPVSFANSNDVPDFLPELSRLNLELICYLAFDVRMGSFNDDERHSTSRSSRLMKAAEDANSCLIPLDREIPFWRLFETSTYRKFRLAQQFMESVAVNLVQRKLASFDRKAAADRKDRRSLLDDYLLNPKLELPDIVGFSTDLLLAGTDTTSNSTAFLLYHIARNPEVQEKAFQEILTVLPDFDTNEITTEKIANNIPYCKAVLKETFRLNPVSVGVGRITNSDLILSGYHVPKESIVVTQNYVACRLEKHFESPLKFIPERWLKTDGKIPKINPHLVLPFSHGTRSCIARRFAEQNMLVLMIRLLRKYEIGWRGVNYLDICTTTTINKPIHPVQLTFKARVV